jgi:DNA adenine methylase
MTRIPHPIPYQGSKRLLAPIILGLMPSGIETLYEPFAGSAAVSLAAVHHGLVKRVHLNDSYGPLIDIWKSIVASPTQLAQEYEALWTEQLGQESSFYDRVRAEFNTSSTPAKLLYLLARCVKNAVRFNKNGEFNQSPDHRRKGMKPMTMVANINGAHRLLADCATCSATDYSTTIARATPKDLVYFDPPYMGVSSGRDRRYARGLEYDRFLNELAMLNTRNVPFLLSFDGRCGTRIYADRPPAELHLRLLEIEAGRSSQATLNGRSDITVESLYISPAVSGTSTPPPMISRIISA